VNSRISPIARAILHIGDPGNEAGRFAPSTPKWLDLGQRAKISNCHDFLEPVAARCARVQGQQMVTASQPNLYRCDQCGTQEIVAVPLLYQQGTRNYSGPFGWGSSQSQSSQAAAPPRPRSFVRPLLLWGFVIFFFFFWGLAGSRAVLQHPKTATSVESAVAIFLFIGVACLGAMILNFRGISRYNREVYPRLRWDWEHTYMCRRCGNFRLIPS